MFILCLALFQQKDLGVVTYTNFGARTEVVLHDLGGLTHQVLKASKNVADIPLTLRLKEAPVAGTLKRIAEVAGAKWVSSDGGVTLTADQNVYEKQEAKRQQRLIADRVLGVQQWIAAQTAPGAKRTSPFATLAAVLSSIGPENLATIDSRYETALGYPSRPLIQAIPDLSKEQLDNIAELRKLYPATPNPDLPEGFNFTLGPPARVRLFADAVQNEVQVTVVVKDENGIPLSQPEPIEMKPSHGMRGLPSQPGKPQEELKVSKDLAAMSDAIEHDDEISKELKAVLADPVNHDPSATLGEYMVALADLKNSQFIGTLNSADLEELEHSGRQVTIDRSSRFTYEDLLYQEGADVSNGWITVTAPPDPHTGRAPQPIQRFLLKYLKSIDTSIAPSLGDLLQAYQAGFETLENQPATRILLPEFSTDFEENLLFLKLLARLTPTQLSALKDGKFLPLADLEPYLQTLISEAVYGPNHEYLDPDGEAIAEALQESGKSDLGPCLAYVDPFEVCKVRLPVGSTLSLEHDTRPMVRGADTLNDDQGNLNRVYSIDEYAVTTGTPPDPVQLGSADEWTFAAHITKYSQLAVKGEFYNFPNPKKLMPSEFPADLKTAFDKAFKDAAEMRKQAAAGQGKPAKP